MKNSDFINVGTEFYINENGSQIEYICIEILKNYARNQIYGYKCLQRVKMQIPRKAHYFSGGMNSGFIYFIR